MKAIKNLRISIQKIWISYKKRREDILFNEFIGIDKCKIKSRKQYVEYGKVLRINPKQLFRKCLIIDTVIPLTFFIPVIFAIIVFIFTLGKETMIDLTKNE